MQMRVIGIGVRLLNAGVVTGNEGVKCNVKVKTKERLFCKYVVVSN